MVGVGTMGAATCLELARRGLRVLGIEQFQLGHDRGSSHGGSRIVRDCYFEAPEYVPLLLACREGWERLERDSGERIVHRPGVFYAGAPGSEVVRRSSDSGERFGVPFERWSAAEARVRYPQFRLPDPWEVLFEPGAGFARPERAVRAAVRVARGRGATVVEGVRVLDWAETASGVRVRTDQGDHEAASLVLTPGAWAPNIATALGVDLRPLRVPIAWLEPRDAAACAEPTMPVWYIDRPGECGIYGVPTAPDQGEPGGVKVAVHGNGTLVDPDAPKQPPTHAELESIRAHTEVFLPAAAGRVLAGAICLYTMSPDEHFVVDRMPGCRCVFVACGFSGHGFKFMPVMGRALADLAQHGNTLLPIGFLKAERLRRAS